MGEFQEYKTASTIVKAVQWFENGDHPEDFSHEITATNGHTFLSEGKVVRRFRNPEVSGEDICSHCGHIMDKHGWIDSDRVGGDGLTVCPSDFVVTNEFGDIYPTAKDIFEREYNLKAGYGG